MRLLGPIAIAAASLAALSSLAAPLAYVPNVVSGRRSNPRMTPLPRLGIALAAQDEGLMSNAGFVVAGAER
jgi:hypothetical protein